MADSLGYWCWALAALAPWGFLAFSIIHPSLGTRSIARLWVANGVATAVFTAIAMTLLYSDGSGEVWAIAIVTTLALVVGVRGVK